MRKAFLGILFICTSISFAILVFLMYNFVTVLQGLG